MNAPTQSTREAFWPWYVRSARGDGASVGPFRRILNVLIALALLVGWYIWTTKSNPWMSKLFLKLAAEHPVFIGGMALAFAAMAFRQTTLDYIAYSIYKIDGVPFPRGIFGNERKLRMKYEQVFGKDTFRNAPEFCGALSILLMLISGLAMVFLKR